MERRPEGAVGTYQFIGCKQTNGAEGWLPPVHPTRLVCGDEDVLGMVWKFDHGTVQSRHQGTRKLHSRSNESEMTTTMGDDSRL